MSAARTSSTLSRADIIALGQRATPLAFLPIAHQALRQLQSASTPTDDPDLRMLIAANYAQLGCPGLATEHLNAIAPSLQTAPPIRSLRAGLESLPLEPTFTVRDTEVRLTRSGNPLARSLPTSPAQPPRAFTDDHAESASIETSLAASNEARHGVVILIGESPAPLVAALRALAPANATAQQPGPQTRITILAPDPLTLSIARAVADVQRQSTPNPFDHPNVHTIATTNSADALAQLERFCQDRIAEGSPPPRLLLVPSSAHAIYPAQTINDANAVLQSAQSTLAAQRTLLNSRVSALYDHAPATPLDVNRPLRILIPTSIHTTYVQHAAADIAAAFSSLGHTVELLKEPNPFARMLDHAYTSAIARFRPDLLIFINYTRAQFPDVFPVYLPIVTYVQDAMPHLLDPNVAKQLGPQDRVIGCRIPELITTFKYPADRCLSIPLFASDQKFRPIAASPNDQPLDIVAITHHSETPEAMLTRLVSEAGTDSPLARAVLRLAPHALDVARRQPTLLGKLAFLDLAPKVLAEELGRTPHPADVSRLINNALMPLADRALRHESLAWAADLARTKNLSFAIFGNGWDRHPTLAPFARPALSHGDDLCRVYSNAALTMHISLHGPLHQRVFETLLAGGFPACRTVGPSIWGAVSHARARAARAFLRENPHSTFPLWIPIANDPSLARTLEVLPKHGIPRSEYEGRYIDAQSRITVEERQLNTQDVDSIAGDLCTPLLDASFSSREQLESLHTLATQHRDRRNAITDRCLAIVRERLTATAVARRILRCFESNPDSTATDHTQPIAAMSATVA